MLMSNAIPRPASTSSAWSLGAMHHDPARNATQRYDGSTGRSTLSSSAFAAPSISSTAARGYSASDHDAPSRQRPSA
jgi:hypothetical protein